MLSLGFLVPHQCPVLSPAWLSDGAPAHGRALRSSTSQPPPLHHLQILFKDLFRFLLVYLLFMIGYASGRCLASEPGLGGRTSPAARLGMARQGAVEPPLHPTCLRAQPLPPPAVERGSAGAGLVTSPILATAPTDSPPLSFLPQLWCPSSTRVPAASPAARSSPTARCPPTPPAGTARPSAPSCSTSSSSRLAWVTWRCSRAPSTLASSSSSSSPTSSSPSCSSSTCSSLSWVRPWAKSPRRASTSGSCRYHPGRCTAAPQAPSKQDHLGEGPPPCLRPQVAEGSLLSLAVGHHHPGHRALLPRLPAESLPLGGDGHRGEGHRWDA